MKYIEICVKTTTEGSELVADVLTELTGDGVSVYDKKDLENPTWDYADETLTHNFDQEVKVFGYAPEDKAAEIIDSLKSRFDVFRLSGIDFGSLEILLSETKDDEWRDVWKKYFKPLKIDNVVICPIWEDYVKQPNQRIVKIDPGLAFGTGEHETTSMVINLMQKIDIKGKSVADVGCGSGILAITASVLGAGSLVLTDLDPQAIQASEKNCSLNGVKAKILQKDLLSVEQAPFDVILANLTADILERLSQDIKKKINPCGELLISGILDVKLDSVLKTYDNCGFEIIEVCQKGEWRAVHLRAKW